MSCPHDKPNRFGIIQRYKLIVIFMDKKIEVKCECKGTGFIASADNGGEGIEHVECAQHHPAFKDAPSVEELSAHFGKQTGISSEFFKD